MQMTLTAAKIKALAAMTDTTARLIDALTIAEKDKMIAILEAKQSALMEQGKKKGKDDGEGFAFLVLQDIINSLYRGGRPLPHK